VYSPERSQNAELSWRGKWFDDRLRTTTTVFAGKERDRFTFDLTSPVSGPIPGSVRERGFEFEFDADLSTRWRLRGGLGLLNSHFSSFAFRYGQPTSEAPPQTMTLGLRYGLATGWYGAADAYHAGVARYYGPPGSLPAYEVLSLRVGWREANWDAALIATNALDKDYIARVQNSAENQIGFRLGDPRRVELRLKWSW
jgi:outer membrane receptor protein involved in Fe transport